jgi:peptidoglycan/LPS O-acetylase OafA/YrhL
MAAFIIAVSFAVNVYTLDIHHMAQTFYSPVARFWELLLGGLLAYIQLHTIHVGPICQAEH